MARATAHRSSSIQLLSRLPRKTIDKKMSRKGAKVFGKIMKMIETQESQLEKLKELVAKYTGEDESGSGSGSSGSDGKKRKTSKWAFWVKKARELFPAEWEAFDKTARGYTITYAKEMREKHADAYEAFSVPDEGEAEAEPEVEKPKKASKKAAKKEESESEAEKPKKEKKKAAKKEESEEESEKPKKTAKRVAKKPTTSAVKEVFGSDSEDE